MTRVREHQAMLFVLSLAAFLVSGTPALGQDDVEEEEVLVNVAPQPVFILNEAQFNQWVFGSQMGTDRMRTLMDKQLEARISDIERNCPLTEAQRKKLWLVGHGDMKRFFDRVEEKRRKLEGMKHDPNKINEIFQEIQPLQVAFHAGLFGEASIFSKTIRRTLSADQNAQYERALSDKLGFRYKARVELMVSTLGNSLGLSAEQRRKFVKVVLAESRPPRNFGSSDYQVVLLQTAKIPEEKLKPIFDTDQWPVLKRYLEQAKMREQFLRNNGYLPAGEDPEPAKPGAPRGKASVQRKDLKR